MNDLRPTARQRIPRDRTRDGSAEALAKNLVAQGAEGHGEIRAYLRRLEDLNVSRELRPFRGPCAVVRELNRESVRGRTGDQVRRVAHAFSIPGRFDAQSVVKQANVEARFQFSAARYGSSRAFGRSRDLY